MTFEMGPETREVQGMWDVSTYKYKMDGRGIGVLADGMKEKKIRGIKCVECGTVYVPGPMYCRKCFVEIDEVVDCSDEGVIMSFCVEMADVRGNPIEQFQIAAMIKFDGADTWFIGTIHNVDWKTIEIGQRVKAIWKDEPEGNLSDILRFERI